MASADELKGEISRDYESKHLDDRIFKTMWWQ